jgi:hypothetical protein
MKDTILRLVAHTVLACGALWSTTLAAAEPPPPVPDIAANLKAFEGKWKCTGKVPDSPYTQAHATKATMVGKLEMNGYWLSLRFDELKAKDNPAPYKSMSFAGWHLDKKTLIRTDVDMLGGVTHLTSKGWEGDTLVWSGEVTSGQKMQLKETFTKKGAKELSSVLELTAADGKPVVIAETSCKK